MLMLASAVMVMLPRDFFASARNMTQLVAFSGYPVSRAAESISQSAKSLAAEPVPAKTHAEALQAKQAVENENIALRREILRLQGLDREIGQLRERTQLREQGRLIPARVVGWDAVPGRDSMVLLKGRSANVGSGSWVTSRLAVEAGTQDGVVDDLRVLARQTLIGWVEQSAPYTSRVVLLSDRYSNRVWRIHIAAVGRENRKPEFVLDGDRPADFALEGIGDGKMRIPDINARFIQEKLIRVGDVVTTDGRDPRLPLAMVIGEIVELEQIKKQPLLYTAIVKHRYDPKELSDVFILDMGGNRR
jgi:cell shape-determining protein MreC